METSQPKLKVWAGDWGLPSVDPDSLTVITYSKFTNAPIIVEESSPSQTVTGNLPELIIEESVYDLPLNIIGILRKEQCNADYNMESIDQAHTLAFSALVEQKLKPGLQSCFWANSSNFTSVTRKAYAKNLGLLRSYWDLPAIRHRIECDLKCRVPGTATDMESYWNQEAKMCITLLSKRLGNRDFFFGSTPTTFDAIAFSHLVLLIKAPLVSTELKNHLLACDNLCKFCGRISQRYFKDETGYWSGNAVNEDNENDKPEGLKEKRNVLIAIGVAVSINIVYLLMKGVLISNKSNARSGLVETEDVTD